MATRRPKKVTAPAAPKVYLTAEKRTATIARKKAEREQAAKDAAHGRDGDEVPLRAGEPSRPARLHPTSRAKALS
jgi:hypothetical protein